MHPNPYGKYVDGLDVLRCLDETPRRIAALVRAWPREYDERSHAPGKWTARQVLAHLAHIEMVFSTRLRFALADDGCRVQTFEQDDWMREETPPPALVSLEAYMALRNMNLVLLRSLSPAQRLRTVEHPELGTIDVDWLAAWCAGHERNEIICRRSRLWLSLHSQLPTPQLPTLPTPDAGTPQYWELGVWRGRFWELRSWALGV